MSEDAYSDMFHGSYFIMLLKEQTKKRLKKAFWTNGGDGGIRTHVPVKATRFRVELVMTTSIRLRAQVLYHKSKQIVTKFH